MNDNFMAFSIRAERLFFFNHLSSRSRNAYDEIISHFLKQKHRYHRESLFQREHMFPSRLVRNKSRDIFSLSTNYVIRFLRTFSRSGTRLKLGFNEINVSHVSWETSTAINTERTQVQYQLSWHTDQTKYYDQWQEWQLLSSYNWEYSGQMHTYIPDCIFYSGVLTAAVTPKKKSLVKGEICEKKVKFPFVKMVTVVQIMHSFKQNGGRNVLQQQTESWCINASKWELNLHFFKIFFCFWSESNFGFFLSLPLFSFLSSCFVFSNLFHWTL